ncbi:MAG: ELM1/GtrOC1 family putative glycosyltransferase [Rubricella sp.]
MQAPPIKRIIAVSDGRAANRRQADALARALGQITGFPVETVDLPLRGALAQAVSAWTGLGDFGVPRGVDTLVIGAGRAGNLAAAWARRGGATAVAVLRPPLPGLRFDAIVVPEHDGISGPAVLTTRGAMHGISEDDIADGARGLRPLPTPVAAVLVGGPSDSARFGAEEEADLLADIGRLAGSHSLRITASRRTSSTLVETLRTKFPQSDVWAGPEDGPNPYPGLLAADLILVTADSVSMLSEALGTGRPVAVTALGAAGPKQRALIESLSDRLSHLEEGRIVEGYAPLREAERIAALLVQRRIVPAGVPGGA